MGSQTLVLQKAWAVCDRWLEDPRAEFFLEPRKVDAIFRRATEPRAAKRASKWVGDCWLLAYAAGTQSALVTFDRVFYEFAQKEVHTAVISG
jgi:predicted nucleic acid-binding protein